MLVSMACVHVVGKIGGTQKHQDSPSHERVNTRTWEMSMGIPYPVKHLSQTAAPRIPPSTSGAHRACTRVVREDEGPCPGGRGRPNRNGEESSTVKTMWEEVYGQVPGEEMCHCPCEETEAKGEAAKHRAYARTNTHAP